MDETTTVLRNSKNVGPYINSMAPVRCDSNLEFIILKSLSRIDIFVKLPSGVCQKSLLVIDEHWFR